MGYEGLLQGPIPHLASLVAKGSVSAEEVTRAALQRIEAENAGLGAFLTVQRDAAVEAAKAVDRKRARGDKLGPLAGVPIGVKDAICTQDAPSTAGSRILVRDGSADPSRGFLPPYDATVVSRLRAADAVIVGKCNMDEFAMGSSTENSAFFPAKNPWDRSRTPGGSSGGSAVAVAAGLTAGALGSDTGGSIRQPASFTGVVGVKPTYGRVSRSGLIAFASSLDQVGPLARDVRSAARILRAIAGRDVLDATSLDVPVDDFEDACGRDVNGITLGVPEEYFADGLDPAVASIVEEAIRGLSSLGCSVRPVHLPHTRFAVATYYVVATAEASSNLARFDGVRYGYRAEGKDLSTLYATTRGRGFGREVKRRIMLGTYALSAGYYDAYYLRAQKVRALIRRDFDAAFREVDAIAAPVSPFVAFRLGEKVEDPLAMYLADVYTLPASLAGLPALSVPAGFALAKGPSASPPLPVGLQLIGPSLSEAKLCSLAAAWESIAPLASGPKNGGQSA